MLCLWGISFCCGVCFVVVFLLRLFGLILLLLYFSCVWVCAFGCVFCYVVCFDVRDGCNCQCLCYVFLKKYMCQCWSLLVSICFLCVVNVSYYYHIICFVVCWFVFVACCAIFVVLCLFCCFFVLFCCCCFLVVVCFCSLLFVYVLGVGLTL